MRVLSRDRLLGELAAMRPEFERDGVSHVALFGSRARQDNRTDSDIDLMLDLVPDDHLSLLDIIGIGHRVEDRFGVPAQLVLRRSASPEFLSRIKADQVVIF